MFLGAEAPEQQQQRLFGELPQQQQRMLCDAPQLRMLCDASTSNELQHMDKEVCNHFF